MGIEWFRDLSITILGFVTTAVLIFIAVLGYRLYRTIKSTLSLGKAASKIAYDTVVLVQDGFKPLLPVLTLIEGICAGFQGIRKLFRKENNKEGKSNE